MKMQRGSVVELGSRELLLERKHFTGQVILRMVSRQQNEGHNSHTLIATRDQGPGRFINGRTCEFQKSILNLTVTCALPDQPCQLFKLRNPFGISAAVSGDNNRVIGHKAFGVRRLAFGVWRLVLRLVLPTSPTSWSWSVPRLRGRLGL